jgi:GNAT superfamily N-acetyltransferase
MLGFAFSWVCGGLWFLAELFVSPVHQGRGIGNELLTRTLDQARKVGATNKALIQYHIARAIHSAWAFPSASDLFF